MRTTFSFLLLLLSCSVAAQAQRHSANFPSAAAPHKATDTTWLPGWKLVEDYRTSTSSWDSLYWHTYTYNSGGFLIVDSNSYYALGAWHPINKMVSDVDSVGHALSKEFSSWSVSGWEPSNRVESTYDSRGNLTLSRTLNWSTAFARWDTVTQNRFTFAYDSNDSVLERIQESWTFGIWQPIQRYTYARNAAGRDSSFVYYEWTGATWNPLGRHDRTYGPTGELVEKWELVASPLGVGWDPLRHYYGYVWHDYSKGQFLSRTQADWTGSTMMEVERQTYVYDALDGYVFILERIDTAGIASNYKRDDEDLDAKGRSTRFEEFHWDGLAWVQNYGKKHYYTDGPGGELLVDEVHQYIPSGYHPDVRYTYGSFSTDAPSHTPGQAWTAFPNPADHSLHLDLPHGNWEISLLSCEGSLVRSMILDGKGGIVPVQDLSPGIYVLRASSPSQVLTRRVAILH